MRTKTEIPSEVEEYRDECWRREGMRQVESAIEAERFIERVGFAACLTDSRRPGPSLYVAVCGRRDAVMPRNVQKDPEASLTWVLKDEIIKRGKVYYAKLARGKAMFLAPRMIPHFKAVWGLQPCRGEARPSAGAHSPSSACSGREWETSTSNLRDESGVKRERAFNRGDGRAPGSDVDDPERGLLSAEVHLHLDACHRPLSRRAEEASRSRRRGARDRPSFLAGAGTTFRGELARVTGLSRPEAGRGNRALVAEGYATMLASGVYRLSAPAQPAYLTASRLFATSKTSSAFGWARLPPCLYTPGEPAFYSGPVASNVRFSTRFTTGRVRSRDGSAC